MTSLAIAETTGLADVARTVIDRVGIPKDRWEIAAQLEVLGYRDRDARDRLGFDDLFLAADAILALFKEGKLLPAVKQDEVEPSRAHPFLFFLRHYMGGVMFSLPMALQGATMLLWGYGLWGAVDLDVRIGSAAALGFIASYVATSGFTWAIVRRGLFYFYQSEGRLARWSALRIWWLAARIALLLILPAVAINAIYTFLPFNLFLVAVVYYAALALLWLNWSLVYLVGRVHWLLGALAISIGVVIVASRLLSWPIVAANVAGLVVADVLTFLIGLHGLNRWARAGGGKPVVNPPRMAVLIYSTAQVFLYGLLYSIFIFTDRILAWTGSRGREDFPPYPFWLNARYELGMDIALVAVVFLAGLVEYSSQHFSVLLVPEQKRVRSENLGAFLEYFRRWYRKHTALLAAGGLVAVLVCAIAFAAMERFPDERLTESLRSTTTIRVFWIATISYAIFMFALRNILMLMILSRADVAVRSIAAALVVNIVIGFIVSRAFHYSGSVVGLLAGSIVLAVLSDRHVRRMFRDLDYFYYAAY